MNNENSAALYARAQKSIAGGHLSNFKQHPGNVQTFFERMDGCHLIDVDGNEYIDWSLSSGPCLMGQSNPILQKALKEQIDKCYSRQYMEVQIEAAELFCKYVPCADLMRFSVTGGENILYAIRVARAYTGKNMIVRFKGMYHGGTDLVFGGTTTGADHHAINGYDEGDPYSHACYTTGRADHALNDTYLVDFNDLDQIEQLFKSDDNIACVLMEPVCLNISGCVAKPEYLRGVRQLCDDYGVVLIFDETLTGFRMALGGAQEALGVIPDMATYAKAVCGGIPGAAFGGKKEIMDVLTDCTCVFPGTYNGNSLVAAAMKCMISELAKNNGEVYERLNRLGNMFKDGVLEAAKRYDIPMIFQGFPTGLFPVFTEKEEILNHKEALKYSNLDMMYRFGALMKQNGVIGDDRYCVSTVHTEEDIARSIDAADRALKQLAEERK